MSVVRRGSAAAVVAGLVLLGGPAWAQEDPCAPGPDGSVPLMCQSGLPVSDTGTVGMEPQEPCLGLPVEPGDGVVTDEGTGEGIAVGEPNPGEPVPTEPKPEPVDPELVDPPRVDPSTGEDAPREPGTLGPDTVICAFGVPVADGAPESATGGGGGTTVRDTASNGALEAGQLPRTGPYDQALALAALGSGLLVVGVGAAAAGRRRRATR